MNLFDLELLREYIEEMAALRAARREWPALFLATPAPGELPAPLFFLTPTQPPQWVAEALSGVGGSPPTPERERR